MYQCTAIKKRRGKGSSCECRRETKRPHKIHECYMCASKWRKAVKAEIDKVYNPEKVR